MEIWKSISNHPNYEVSNLGRIWSKYRNRCKNHAKSRHRFNERSGRIRDTIKNRN